MFDRWLERKLRRYTGGRKALAKELGVDPTTVGRWIDEGRRPERQHVLRLAKIFNVSIETIVRQTDPELFYDWNDPQREEKMLSDLYTDVPEMQEVARRLREMPPAARRAWLTLLLGEDAGSGEPDQ